MDILSQDEIDSLLAAISSGDAQQEDFSYSQRNERKVRIYDFKRPSFLTKHNINAFSMMFENYSRNLGVHLTKQLNKNTTVDLQSIDQFSFDEFRRSIPNPCYIGHLEMIPLKGEAFYVIEPSLYKILLASDTDILFKDDWYKLSNALAPMHTNLLEEAFSPIVELKPMLVKTFQDPFLLNFVKKTMCVELTLEVCIELPERKFTNSYIHIAIPEYTLSKIKGMLNIHNISGNKTEPKPLGIDVSQAEILGTIGFKSKVPMFIKDVESLKVGDMIILESGRLELWY